MQLPATLEQKLIRCQVVIEVQGRHQLYLGQVPVNPTFYNKARTNLLLTRPQSGQPFLLCLDDDLQYAGRDPQLRQTFARGLRQQGWQILLPLPALVAETRMIELALAMLGFDGAAPTLPPTATSLVLSDREDDHPPFGRNLSALARTGQSEFSVGRGAELQDALVALLQWRNRLPLVVGASGVGKTNFLHALAQQLLVHQPSLQLIAVDLAAFFSGCETYAEREQRLVVLLEEAAQQPQQILALEHLELAAAQMPHGPLLLSQALDQGVRLIGTCLPQQFAALARAPLLRRLQWIELQELSETETLAALEGWSERITMHQQVRMEEELLCRAVEQASVLPGVFPAKALALLDAAVTQARLAGRRELTLADLEQASFCPVVTPAQ